MAGAGTSSQMPTHGLRHLTLFLLRRELALVSVVVRLCREGEKNDD
jgi:hypothetical protein